MFETYCMSEVVLGRFAVFVHVDPNLLAVIACASDIG